MSALQGRSVLVAGASGGLGAPVSRLLAEHGARLTLVGRDRARLEQVGVDGVTVPLDLRKAGMPDRAVEAALAAYGGLDGVVYAAGVAAFGPALDTPDEVLVEVFTINTLAPIRLLRAAADPLRRSAEAGNDPFVLTLSAVLAEQPMAGMAGYAASKAAITAFDTAAARELRREGIRLVDVRPPHTETGLATRPVHGTPPRLPQGLEPDAVARRIVAAIVEGERDLPSTAFASG